jgi:hypothetical protein
MDASRAFFTFGHAQQPHWSRMGQDRYVDAAQQNVVMAQNLSRAQWLPFYEALQRRFPPAYAHLLQDGVLMLTSGPDNLGDLEVSVILSDTCAICKLHAAPGPPGPARGAAAAAGPG